MWRSGLHLFNAQLELRGLPVARVHVILILNSYFLSLFLTNRREAVSWSSSSQK
jgi:hypothetical protein